MPRRKKKVKETPESQNLEKDEDTTNSVTMKRKRKLEDAFIVISDSDGEVSILKSGALGLRLELLLVTWFCNLLI